MTLKQLLIFVVAAAALSCKKDDNGGNYIVSAGKMIAITSRGWAYAEPELSDEEGYQYSPGTQSQSPDLKAVVSLPAVDDSNRTVNGTILLNVANDNRVFYAAFTTDPLAKAVAYAMLLHYNRMTLQNVTGISSSICGYVQNGMGGNTTVSAILTKVQTGEDAGQLDLTYTTPQGRFTMAVFREADGRFVFSYRGNR